MIVTVGGPNCRRTSDRGVPMAGSPGLIGAIGRGGINEFGWNKPVGNPLTTGGGGKAVWPGTRIWFGTITVGKFGTKGTTGTWGIIGGGTGATRKVPGGPTTGGGAGGPKGGWAIPI